MADKLKIYACSGIGETPAGRKWEYWTDNTVTVRNTQAVNTLLALINEKYTELAFLRTLTDEQAIKNLNAIDLYVVCLDAAQRLSEQPDQLHLAGVAISVMYSEGAFSSNVLDEAERDRNLDQLITTARQKQAAAGWIKSPDEKFMSWWSQYVDALNKVGLSDEEQEIVTDALDAAKVSGIGASDYNENADLAKYLNNAGEYFMYRYFTEEQLASLPRVFTTKKKQQDKIYNYCKGLFTQTYGTQDAMDRIIRSKIIEQSGDTPENVCATIADSKRKVAGIGVITVAEIITIITSIVVPVVVAIIGAICDAVAKKNADKYAAINQMAIDGGVPNEEDLKGIDYSSLKTSSLGGGNLGMLAAGGVLLFLLFGTKGKKIKK